MESTAGSLNVCKLGQMSGLAVLQQTIYVSTADSNIILAIDIDIEKISGCGVEGINIFDVIASASTDASSNICHDGEKCK